MYTYIYHGATRPCRVALTLRVDAAALSGRWEGDARISASKLRGEGPRRRDLRGGGHIVHNIIAFKSKQIEFKLITYGG